MDWLSAVGNDLSAARRIGAGLRCRLLDSSNAERVKARFEGSRETEPSKAALTRRTPKGPLNRSSVRLRQRLQREAALVELALEELGGVSPTERRPIGLV